MDKKHSALYDLLGVSTNAGQNDIKTAYRRLAKQYHPDINKSSESTNRMVEINYAYSILSDPAKRAAYDAGIRIEEEEGDREYENSVAYAESFAQQTRCQGCGRFDHTLRIATFPYVVSIFIASFKNFAEPGIFCDSCRCNKSIKWAIVSLIFGWWSVWGFFWNIGALIDNFRGGKMPREENAELVAQLAWVHMLLGKIAEAKSALKDLLGYGSNEEALNLKQELDRKYPGVSPVMTGNFRLGYLAVVFAVLGLYVILAMALFGGTTEPVSTQPSSPSQPSVVTPSPSSTAPQQSSSAESENLVNNKNAGPITWNNLLDSVEILLDDILPYIEDDDPEIDGMTMLHNKLEEKAIKTGLVSINIEYGEPLHACIAVETVDRGIVFLDLVPLSLGIEGEIPEDEYMQTVYLQEGKRIGFIPARLAKSTEYSWYTDYLESTYEYFDFYVYLNEFSKVIDRNSSRLDDIEATIDEIEYLLLSGPPNYTSERERLFNDRIDRFNSYIEDFNRQVEEYMTELNQSEKNGGDSQAPFIMLRKFLGFHRIFFPQCRYSQLKFFRWF